MNILLELYELNETFIIGVQFFLGSIKGFDFA